MKTIIAAGILLASGSAALAGPYVNVESNSGRYGNSYLGTVIESHIGYEGVIGETGADWYVQSVLHFLCLMEMMLKLTSLVRLVLSMTLLMMWKSIKKFISLLVMRLLPISKLVLLIASN